MVVIGAIYAISTLGLIGYFVHKLLRAGVRLDRLRAGFDAELAAVGPEHSHLREIGRADYAYATDDEALAAFHELARTEGIIPALESAHAIAHAIRVAPTMNKDQIILVNLSGRGDKDVQQVADGRGDGH